MKEPSSGRRDRNWRLRREAAVLLAALAFLGNPAPSEAGALGKSVFKAAAARISAPGRSSLAREGAKQNPATAARTAERAALNKHLQRLDAQTLTRIEQRYGAHIAPDRLRQTRSTQTQFLDHADYQRQMSRHYPAIPAGRRQNVVGNYLNGQTYVDRNQLIVPRTLAHERLHQLADPRHRRHAGSRLDEGMTEYFSGRIYGDLSLRDIPKAYPAQQRIVELMATRVGERPLARAYFSGEVSVLRSQIDRQLGAGAFDDIVRSTERGNSAAAIKRLGAGH